MQIARLIAIPALSMALIACFGFYGTWLPGMSQPVLGQIEALRTSCFGLWQCQPFEISSSGLFDQSIGVGLVTIAVLFGLAVRRAFRFVHRLANHFGAH